MGICFTITTFGKYLENRGAMAGCRFNLTLELTVTQCRSRAGLTHGFGIYSRYPTVGATGYGYIGDVSIGAMPPAGKRLATVDKGDLRRFRG